MLARLTGPDRSEIGARLGAGQRAYVNRLDGAPVPYGRVATATASISELDLAFALTPGDRYPWDFATLRA